MNTLNQLQLLQTEEAIAMVDRKRKFLARAGNKLLQAVNKGWQLNLLAQQEAILEDSDDSLTIV